MHPLRVLKGGPLQQDAQEPSFLNRTCILHPNRPLHPDKYLSLYVWLSATVAGILDSQTQYMPLCQHPTAKRGLDCNKITAFHCNLTSVFLFVWLSARTSVSFRQHSGFCQNLVQLHWDELQESFPRLSNAT